MTALKCDNLNWLYRSLAENSWPIVAFTRASAKRLEEGPKNLQQVVVRVYIK
jgi:hypothetical protein